MRLLTEGIIYTVLNVAAILVCLLAAILVFVLKLHKKVVYRLALYQVLAALFMAIVNIFETVPFIQYKANTLYRLLCITAGWFGVYSEWIKLLFTIWVTFHLFCFAVLHKNLKKLEVLYVVTSLLIPAVIASVPLITHSYGLNSFGNCYLYATNDTHHIALIEVFALWDGPAMVILLAASTAMLVVLIKLAHRACWRFKYEEITDGDQYWKALKQLLPLAAFPIVFFVFIVPVFIFDITSNDAVEIAASVFIPLWSVASGVTLLVHISVAHRYGRNQMQQYSLYSSAGNPTVRQESISYVNSNTSVVPIRSIIRELYN